MAHIDEKHIATIELAHTNTIEELESKYNDIVSNNNWRDNDESKQLALAYIIHSDRGYCMECDRQSSIECQYH